VVLAGLAVVVVVEPLVFPFLVLVVLAGLAHSSYIGRILCTIIA
jgi:hypothetical protein